MYPLDERTNIFWRILKEKSALLAQLHLLLKTAMFNEVYFKLEVTLVSTELSMPGQLGDRD